MLLTTLLLLVSSVQLQNAMHNAQDRWGLEAPNTTVEWALLNDCNLKKRPDVAHTELTKTVLHFDDAPDVTTYGNVIKVNLACRWDLKYLDRVLLHEYGHALGVDHNPDPKSIMYWIVYTDREQTIDERDHRLAGNPQR